MKIAFLDRDGTIVKDYLDHEWSFIETPVFLPGAMEGLKDLKEAGYAFIVITNQYIINQGYITESQYHEFNRKMVQTLKLHGILLLDIFYCPHTSEENCLCKKPEIGMFQQALAKYPNIDLENSIMFGDSRCDLEFAGKVGIDFYGIKGGGLARQDLCYDSVKQGVNRLKDKCKKE